MKKYTWLRPWYILGAIHSTKISGNFGPKLNGSVRSNRKSFEKTGPPFEVVLFSRSDQSEFWLNGSRPLYIDSKQTKQINSREFVNSGFRSVVVITSAPHAEGRQFKSGWKHFTFFFKLGKSLQIT